MKPVLESVNEFEKLVIVLLEFPEEYNSLRVKKIFEEQVIKVETNQDTSFTGTNYY